MSSSSKNRFAPFRYLSVVAVVTSGMGAALMFAMAVVKTAKAYAIFAGEPPALLADQSVVFNRSIALVVQSIDAFMIGMVLMMFSFGVTTLFIKKIDLPENDVFSWVRVTNINHLKVILGEMIIIVLFVKFLEIILLNVAELKFEMLVLPVGIVLLALALKFLGLAEEHKG